VHGGRAPPGRVGSAATAAEQHYITYGLREGRTSGAFDVDGYLASNTDVLAATGGDRDSAARHWLDYGRGEGRGTTAFDATAYMRANPDVAAAFGTNLQAAMQHYVDHGYQEGRRTTPSAGTGIHQNSDGQALPVMAAPSQAFTALMKPGPSDVATGLLVVA
jgi:hypothetical protein